MSAALLLGRCLRTVLVCDSGRPRNAMARQFNGFLSRDGSSPAEFRQLCRSELQRYETIAWLETEVLKVERLDQAFMTTLANGERVSSKMVLLTMGIADELPQMEGFLQFYGTTIHSCPFCDAFECKDQPLAVIGGSQEAADLAVELRQWSPDIVLCSDGELSCSARTLQQLHTRKVRLECRHVKKLEGQGPHLEAILFEDGTRLLRRAMFFSPRQHQHNAIPESLGCKICSETGCIECDETMCTSVPGLYAAGNASKGVQMVVFAAAEGARAAVDIQNALLEAELRSDT
jgi:thioredoxin reductase